MTEAVNRGEYATLPCPFCGQKPYVSADMSGGVIRCETHECFGPRTTAQYLVDAVKQWNTRSAAPAEQGEVVAWVKQMHTDLRRLAIKQHVRMAEGGGTVPNGKSCATCKGEWAEGAPEFHAETCTAAKDSPALASPPPPSDAPGDAVQDTYLVGGPDLRAMSGSTESDRIIQLWFRRKATDEDRKWLLEAINAKILADQEAAAPPLSDAEITGLPSIELLRVAIVDGFSNGNEQYEDCHWTQQHRFNEAARAVRAALSHPGVRERAVSSADREAPRG